MFLQYKKKSEQLNEYMFQRHKINVGRKFQAEIPKFQNIRIFLKIQFFFKLIF